MNYVRMILAIAIAAISQLSLADGVIACSPKCPVVAMISYADAISVHDQTIEITQAAHDDIVDQSLHTIMYQAASDPVFDGEGDQMGYVIFDIDPGSIYDIIGLKNFDIVVDVDGIKLTDPKISVDALRSVKYQEDFTYTILRGKERLKFRVKVK